MGHETLTQCAAVAAWGSAVLRGDASPDRAMDVVRALGGDVVFTNDDQLGAVHHSFALAVGSWRSRGIQAWRYAPVSPGDSGGVPGPKQLQARALDAGAALICTSGATVALVPSLETESESPGRRAVLAFAEVPADGQGATPPESLGELDRALLTSLTEVSDRMDELEVASWREDVATLLRSWDRAPDMPPGTSDRACRLAARSGRVLALVELATADDGGSRTATEMSERAEHLRQLARVARAAHAAAWNAAVLPSPMRR